MGGFSMLGTEADLTAMAADIKKFNAVDLVLDPRSFRGASLTRRQDYFALDFFLKLNDPADLPKFLQSWGDCRDLAATIPSVLSLGMGVHKSSDGKTVMMQLKETYEDAAAYQDWLPKDDMYAKAFFALANFSMEPNPFAMTGHPLQLQKVAQHCKDVGCVQYTLDNCTDVDSTAEMAADALPSPPSPSDADTSLFIEPFYKLNDPSNTTATTVFRKAYCDARQIGNK